MARSLAAVCTLVLCGGCSADGPLGPAGDESWLAAVGGSGPPASLASRAISPSRIDLTWRDGSSNETGFEVHRSTTGPVGTFAMVQPPTAADVTTFSDVGVTPATQYCYKVRAFRTAGRRTSYSGFTDVSCATTPATPPAPSNVTAALVSADVVRVSWSDNSTTESGFRVQRGPSPTGPWTVAATRDPGVTSYFDEGRPAGQQVCYQVIAFNVWGESPPSSDHACTTPPAPPAPPANLVARTAPGGQAIDLTWTHDGVDTDAFEVQRLFVYDGGYCYYYYYYPCEPSIEYRALVTLTGDARSYHDAEVAPGEEHSYRVVALKGFARSEPSNEATAWSDAAPAAPSGLRATAITSGRIDLEWTDNASTEDRFSVERCRETETACGDAAFELLDFVSADATAYSDAAVEPAATYTYRVRAHLGLRPSDPSNQATATTPASSP